MPLFSFYWEQTLIEWKRETYKGRTKMTNNQWFKGVFLLTIAGFAGKILSASYRVPLQNMAGDEGIYIYQQIYPFIMIAWMLSIYGYPAALSKITNDQYNGTKKIVFPMKLLVMLCSVNIIFFVLDRKSVV